MKISFTWMGGVLIKWLWGGGGNVQYVIFLGGGELFQWPK